MTSLQRVRFDDAAKSVTPLKGVLKKPEVVLPMCVGSYYGVRCTCLSVAASKNRFSKSAESDEGEDVFGYVSLYHSCSILLFFKGVLTTIQWFVSQVQGVF
jgi:hypothetical protein